MNNRTIIALSILCVLLFFAFDLYIELGVAGGVTYVIAILLLAFQDNKKLIWFGAILTSLLTVLGLFLSPSGGEAYKVITNRFLALFIIWGTSFLVVKFISLQSQLSKTKSMLLLKGVDKQHKRIATELHENSVQLIAAAKSLINKIKREKETGNHTEINEASLILDSAILELKNISYELQPSVLKDFGLMAGMKILIDTASINSNINIQLNTNFKEETRFENHLEINLFKIAQECLNISLNNAIAKNINIHLLLENNKITFNYRDDGDYESLENENISLLNIKERCEIIEGEYHIVNSGSNSFKIDVVVPNIIHLAGSDS